MGRGLSPPPLAAVRLPLPPLPGPGLAARLARRGSPGPLPRPPRACRSQFVLVPTAVVAPPCGGAFLIPGAGRRRSPRRPPPGLAAPPCRSAPGGRLPPPGSALVSVAPPRGVLGLARFAGGGPGVPARWPCGPGAFPPLGPCPGPPPPPRRGPGWCGAGLGAWRCWAWRPCLVGGPLNPAFAGPILGRGGGWRYSAPHPLAPPARAAGPPWLASLVRVGTLAPRRPPVRRPPPGALVGAQGWLGCQLFFAGLIEAR